MSLKKEIKKFKKYGKYLPYSSLTAIAGAGSACAYMISTGNVLGIGTYIGGSVFVTASIITQYLINERYAIRWKVILSSGFKATIKVTKENKKEDPNLEAKLEE